MTGLFEKVSGRTSAVSCSRVVFAISVQTWPLGAAGVYAISSALDRFTNANDPHNEHDFGSFDFRQEVLLENRLLQQDT